jgi:hypothetical protein
MSRKRIALFLLASLCLALAGCKTIDSASSFVSSKLKEDPNPSSARLSQLNHELGETEARIAKLTQDRHICEVQRFESLTTMAEITGMGPKKPKGLFEEELVMDPGSYYQMHNDNVTAANEEIRKIDAESAHLRNKAATLKAERAELEKKAVASSRTGFPESGGCFTPDTGVAVRGASRPIGSVSAGDEVMVAEEAGGRIGYRPVLNTFRFTEDHYFLLNGEIRATALHRFLTEEGWVRAKDLREGMKLKTADGWTVLRTKKLIEVPIEVFNLEVAEEHVFFVSAGGERYLVHNTGGGGGK